MRGQAIATDGKFVVKKGSVCAPAHGGFIPEIRKNANIKDNILQEDVVCTSPSSAGYVVIGRANNGWTEWKDKSRRPIDIYRIENEL